MCCLRVLHYLLRACWVASRAMRPIRVNRMAPTSCQRRNVIPWRVQIAPRGFMWQIRVNQMASTSCRRRNVIPWRVQIAARRAMQPIRVKRTAFTSCQRSYASWWVQIACGASFGVGRCIPGKNNNEWYVGEGMHSSKVTEAWCGDLQTRGQSAMRVVGFTSIAVAFAPVPKRHINFLFGRRSVLLCFWNCGGPVAFYIWLGGGVKI